MDFIEMLRARRSCRSFSDTPIERSILDRLLEATLTAPSSKNCRSSRLAVVDDRALLQRIAAMRSHGSQFLAEAPAAIVVMGDPALTDLWVDNCAISAVTLQYAAQSLGLGSCWVHVNGRAHNDDDPAQGTAEEYLKRFLSVPAEWRIHCIVALGHPDREARPRPEHDDSDKVIFL